MPDGKDLPPPPGMRATGRSGRLRPRGSSQEGVRQFNERVVLQTMRLHGSLSKAELARLTGLTAQAIKLIVARLEADGLVRQGDRLRGRVGQPSTPIDLDPDGAFAIGVRLGRRGLNTLLVDMTGRIRHRLALAYDFPDPVTLFPAIAQQLESLHGWLGPARAAKLMGIGLAAPLGLGGWSRILGIDPGLASAWSTVDPRATLQGLTELPVHFAKDTIAACVAELVAGRGREVSSFLYLFVDTFIGGGLVLDSHLHGGLHGNAGAVASLPLPGGEGSAPGAAGQLLSTASLWALESAYRRQGLDPAAAYDARALQAPHLALTRQWLASAAPAIAAAVVSGVTWLDIGAAVVDGSCDRGLLDLLLAQVQEAVAAHNWEGLWRPTLLGGTIGADAQALGGALLPLHACFAPDRSVFLKDIATP